MRKRRGTGTMVNPIGGRDLSAPPGHIKGSCRLRTLIRGGVLVISSHSHGGGPIPSTPPDWLFRRQAGWSNSRGDGVRANPASGGQNILLRLRFSLVDSNRAALWLKPYDCPDTIRNGAAGPAKAGEEPAYRARLWSLADPRISDGVHAGILALGLRYGT